MRILVGTVIIGLIMLAGGISAQVATPANAPNYRLRNLTASEFLEALPNFEAINYEQAKQLILAAEAEFWVRFGDTATFFELQGAFERLRAMVAYRSYRERIPAIDMNAWVARLIEQWLNEESTDFNNVEAMRAYPLMMTIEPHDFDLDGRDEWILDVQYRERTGEVGYRNFLIADGDSPEYRILPLPIPYTSGSYTWSDDNDDYRGEGNEYYRNLGFRDITADGQMEWLFSTNELGPGGPGYTGIIHRV